MSALTTRGSTRRWRQLRALVLDRDSHRCQLPADVTGRLCLVYATHVDHITPRVAGGSDEPSNLRAACARHNLERGAGTGEGPAPRLEPAGGRWRW